MCTDSPLDDPFERSPDIRSVRPHYNGTYLTLACRRCGQAREALISVVAGIPIGTSTCPECGLEVEVYPEDVEAVLDRFWPMESTDEVIDLMAEASRIVQTWPLHPPFAALFTYQGINLAETTQFSSWPYVVQGLIDLKHEASRTP